MVSTTMSLPTAAKARDLLTLLNRVSDDERVRSAR
jgi:hypothetical protein